MIADVRLDGYTPAPVAGQVRGRHAADHRGDRVRRRRRLPPRRRHGARPRPRAGAHRYALDTLTERFGDDIRMHGPTNADAARRRAQLRVPRPPPARRVAGARPAQRVRPCRSPLRQAADAGPRRRRHRAGELVSLQRPRRHRRPGRRPRRRVGHLRFSSHVPEEHVHARSRRPVPRDHPRPLPHAAQPRRAADAAGVVAHGHNPLCGDEITVYLQVDDDAVTDVKVGGQGCSISQSSASMMSQAIKGRSVDEVRALVRRFKGMMSIDTDGDELDADGDAASSPATARARRPRGAAGRREVPGAHQVRDARLEHAARRPRPPAARRRDADAATSTGGPASSDP